MKVAQGKWDLSDIRKWGMEIGGKTFSCHGQAAEMILPPLLLELSLVFQ